MKQVGFSQNDFDSCLKNQKILDGVTILASAVVPPPIESPDLRRRARRKQLAIVAAVGLALFGSIAFFAWRAFGSRADVSR